MNPSDGTGQGGPLAGLRIVEFAGIGPGPFAAMLLADMGAELVRLDRPGGADPYSRNVVARGRPTVTVDLKDPADRAGALALLERADALIEGFRPGVMERLGLGPDAVLARNPRLVYGRMTGWGQDGPLARAAGHDITYMAVTGALAAIGPAERPVPPLNLVGDYGGGALYLVTGLLAALLSAGRTGRGQVVDAAICDGAASLMAMFSELASQGRWSDRREANLLDGGAPWYRTYACADGNHVALGALEPHFYALFRRLTGLDADPDFDRRDDPEIWPVLRRKLEALFLTKTRDDWCRLLEGTDACLAPVLALGEAADHPHLAARQTFVTVDGTVQPAPAPRFSGTPSAIRPAAGPLTLAEAVRRWSGEGTFEAEPGQ
ncbi:CaiB/BaiF CoA transferase family protein [Methylobacterium platani]|uniref:Carnitine dehydratase n=2 Tax=Methylobacterium platani TaxID=427683 RepID=A0A179S5J7_9HYPH|nr:CaiB/BaiF CoA-transferase family protein [Methylobacterium platani]KMO11409.1 carnitine dehydratase [Methylobacterium platani JCM 14648]OAS21968.1 carnitine dehydratase [Methylobacterium platani]